VYLNPDVAERVLMNESEAIKEIEKNSQSRIFILSDQSLHREDVNITFVK